MTPFGHTKVEIPKVSFGSNGMLPRKLGNSSVASMDSFEIKFGLLEMLVKSRGVNK